MARKPFEESLPRAGKASRGRVGAGVMPPLAIRGRGIEDAVRRDARERLGRKLGKFAAQIERATVRFEDVNGPKGGVDTACRVKVVLRGAPSIVVEELAASAGEALARASAVAERAVRRTLERHGRSSPREARGKSGVARPSPKPRAREGDEGSLIGRRVGRSRANLARALARPEKERRDAFVDTAAPGTSASDRKAGYGATAARNTRAAGSALTYALEDSRGKPSRKSTRKSGNRARASAPLERTVSLQAQSPTARARRSAARRHR